MAHPDRKPVAGIYFLQGEITKLIKIGFSRDIAVRIEGFRAGSPDVLNLIGAIEGSLVTEKFTQDDFANDRRQGEWFEPVPELVAMVASIVAGKPVFGLPKNARPVPAVAQKPPPPPAPPLSHGAQLLALAVKARGLSVNDAGKAIAAPIGLMSRLLTGKRRPTRRVAITIADAFGVPMGTWDIPATQEGRA